jgi:Domain of unknown function (DUF5666)
MQIRHRAVLETILGFFLISAGVVGLLAQQNQAPPPYGQQRGMRPTGERSGGTITSVGVDRFEVKRMNGETQTVLVNDSTRISEGSREDRKQLGLEDLKPGDRVMVMGKTNDHQEFVADFVHRLTPEEAQRFQNSGDRAFGQIVSINGNEIKINNRFRGDMTVVVNDQTSFMKDQQKITLKDLKAGDRIFATGKETDGKLTADRVMTGRMQRGRGRLMSPPAQDQPPQQN